MTVFRTILPIVPLSLNAYLKRKSLAKKRFFDQLEMLTKNVDFQKYSSGSRLYFKVIYFEHNTSNIRDIDNVFKPILDFFSKKIYHNDEQIKHILGFKLEMLYNTEWFDVVIDISSLRRDEIKFYLTETCLLIEIGNVPLSENDVVTWYGGDDEA